MKVGDLVTLSAYGYSVARTGWVAHRDVGLISKTKTYVTRGQSYLAYEVRWIKSKFSGRIWNHERWFDRRDLKYVKKSKK